jgi:hypothetical protein
MLDGDNNVDAKGCESYLRSAWMLAFVQIYINLYMVWTSLPVFLLIIYQASSSIDLLCAGRDGFFA